MQQWHVRLRPVYAPRMLRAMGSRRACVLEVLRPGPLLVWKAKTPEFMDEKRVRFGVQGLRLSMRKRALEERSRLGASRCGSEGRGWEETSPASEVWTHSRGHRRPHQGLQPIELRFLFPAISAFWALGEPYSCPGTRCDLSKEKLQARDCIRQDQVRFLFVFQLFFLLSCTKFTLRTMQVTFLFCFLLFFCSFLLNSRQISWKTCRDVSSAGKINRRSYDHRFALAAVCAIFFYLDIYSK